MKILTSNSPSYVRAEVGSWASMSFGNAKGEVEVHIIERESGSYVNLNFNFLKEYMIDSVAAIIGAMLVYVVMWWVASGRLPNISPLLREDYLSEVNWLTLVLISVIFVLVIGISGYNAQVTRRRFIEEINMFVQSLHPKRAN